MKSNAPYAWWLRSLLIGSAYYAIANGLAHKSDWCYLAASAAVAAAILVAGRAAARAVPLLWDLGCTLAVFGPGFY